MRASLAITTLLIAAACSGADSDAPATEAPDIPPATTVEAPAPAAPAVTDPQIAAIVVAANQVDITAGELAVARGTSPQVKEFAQRMITDHTGVNQAAGELVGRLGVTPEANPTSEKLTRDGELSRSALERESGAAFDRAYMDNEVTYHEAVLAAIDQTLIPNAQNAELKKLLEDTRPAVDAHLQHARTVRGALGSN